jgi:hypothetical protein
MGFDVKEDEEVYSAPPPPKGFTSNCRGGGSGWIMVRRGSRIPTLF